MVGRDATSCFVSRSCIFSCCLFLPFSVVLRIAIESLLFTRAGSLIFSVLRLSAFDCCPSRPLCRPPTRETVEPSFKSSHQTKIECGSLLLPSLPWPVYGSSHSLPRKKQLQARAIYTSLELSPTQPALSMLCVWVRPPCTWNTSPLA